MGKLYRLLTDSDVERNIYDIEDYQKHIYLGEGQYYYILCDEEPYLVVGVDKIEYFSDAVLFYEYLVIGHYQDGIFIIQMDNLEIMKKRINGYFGYFEMKEDFLYVLGCSDVIAFDKQLNVKWESLNLAVDGIVCEEITETKMKLSCEMDPPGGWREKILDCVTGQQIK